MFCPRCGSNQTDELNFCKACGANLQAVRQAVDARETDQKFDWSKTWVADMLTSGEEAVRRQEEINRRLGINPATRRYQEIKAGVITGSVGAAVSIFLAIFMEGIIRSGQVTTGAAEILSHVWVAGLIPLFLGLALIVNGYFVSRKIVELWSRNQQLDLAPDDRDSQPHLLRAADTSEFVPARFSVTEGTTQHLESSGQTPSVKSSG